MLREQLLLAATIALLLVGCDSHRPMNDRTLDLYANTRLQAASVTLPEGTINLAPDEYDSYRELVICLKPIETVKKGNMQHGGYALSWFAGMDPATIHLSLIDEDLLRYSLDGYCYTGGDARRFRELTEALAVTFADRMDAR